MSALEMVRAGPLTTVQDLGRPGYAHLGVPPSGALDRASLRLANRLVGNPESFAGLETTLLGCDLRLTASRWVAVTGAPSPVAIDGQPAAADRPVFLPRGRLLHVGSAISGVRAYVAVAGGLAVPPVLGSRSTDLLSGLGPPPVSSAVSLPLGRPGADPSAVDCAPQPLIPSSMLVRLFRGPRDDWFDTPYGLTYVVGTDSNRVGVRLRGPALERRIEGELPSEGMVLGAVQVPPSGQPVILLADHPTTGGYPVIGVVHPDDLWLLAQARPGTRLSFTPAAF